MWTLTLRQCNKRRSSSAARSETRYVVPNGIHAGSSSLPPFRRSGELLSPARMALSSIMIITNLTIIEKWHFR